jgi:hypothetical protein
MKQAIDPTANQQGEANSSEGSSTCQDRFDLIPRDRPGVLPDSKPRLSSTSRHVEGRDATGGLVSPVTSIGSAAIES